MTQKEKDAMAREVMEWYKHEQNREPIIIIDPEGSYAPLVNRCGRSVAAATRRESNNAVKKEVS